MANIEILFDESAWNRIEELLPDDETVRRIALEDFMWFIGRPKKYKNDVQKAADYIRHLRLKVNAKFMPLTNNADVLKSIDIDRIELKLLG